jgi:hypothetical protein
MCSSGGQVGQTDEALQASQAAMTTTLNDDYTQSFHDQQTVLANLQARANFIASNPFGYTPQQLAQQTTSINENTATAARQAMGSAAAFAAAHGGGGADIGSGVSGQIAGQIASAATESKAQQLQSLSQQNQAMKQQNFWNAISTLNSVGSQYGGAGGTAIGGAGSAASTAVGAGTGALAAQQAGWQDIGGVVSGVAGLASAGAGIIDANPNGIFGK